MERMKDNVDERKENVEAVLETKLNFKVTSWLKVTYSGLKLLKKVFSSYVDLVTDSILLGTILAVVALSLENFNSFPSQVGIILLSSIIVPLITSAATIAFTRPYVILNSQQWRELAVSESKISLYIARTIIILCSPFIPAMIIVSKEWAKDKLDSLKSKYDNEEKTVKESVIEEFDRNVKFIKEARQEQLQISKEGLVIFLKTTILL